MPESGVLRSCLIFCLLFLLTALSAESLSIAFLPIENLSANPRYDYLEGIIKGILQYDLSSEPGLEVVDRSQLEHILKEQELRLGSLADDQGKALEVGRIIGADYLLKGEYVFLGDEVLVTISLLDVTTARTTTFRERGSSENMLHCLAEQIIFRFLGKQIKLQSNQRDRSIISLRDETPGLIALHSHLVEAEIFLNDEFVGYTTGDGRIPFMIENVAPGLHRLRIHLQDFGVVREPEITFHDWQEEVEVRPGKRHVIRAKARHFNDLLYDLQKLLREEIGFGSIVGKDELIREHDVSFIDRQGKTVGILLKIAAILKGEDVEVRATLLYEGKAHRFALSNRDSETKNLREEIEKIELRIEIDWNSIDYSVWRTDIKQNMFR